MWRSTVLLVTTCCAGPNENSPLGVVLRLTTPRYSRCPRRERRSVSFNTSTTTWSPPSLHYSLDFCIIFIWPRLHRFSRFLSTFRLMAPAGKKVTTSRCALWRPSFVHSSGRRGLSADYKIPTYVDSSRIHVAVDSDASSYDVFALSTRININIGTLRVKS